MRAVFTIVFVCRSNTAGVNINEAGVAVQAPPEAQPETLAYDVVIRGDQQLKHLKIRRCTYLVLFRLFQRCPTV